MVNMLTLLNEMTSQLECQVSNQYDIIKELIYTSNCTFYTADEFLNEYEKNLAVLNDLETLLLTLNTYMVDIVVKNLEEKEGNAK